MRYGFERAGREGRRWRWRASCLLAALLMAPAGAWAGARVRVVDVHASVKDEPDVACTAEGETLVVYRRFIDQNLTLARVSPSGTVISDLCGPSLGVAYPSAVVDSQGLLTISHMGFNGALAYTLVGGDVFGLNTVPISQIRTADFPTHMLDAQDRPFIAYRDNLYKPAVARFDIPSGKWVTETIPGLGMTQIYQRLITIAKDRLNQPVVAYYNQSGTIRLATRTADGWVLRSYLPSPATFPTSGMALDFDSANAAHVAIALDYRLNVLRFGTLGVSTIYISDTSSPVKFGPHSMCIDTNDRINLAYYDAGAGKVTVATRTALWSTVDVDTKLGATAPAIALDSANRWVIAYVDEPFSQLKVCAQAWWDFARPDFNDDGHVDGTDVLHLLAEMTGPNAPQTEMTWLDADLDGDGDVDQTDFGILQACYSGPVELANPRCAD
jgi:hypothetical protein